MGLGQRPRTGQDAPYQPRLAGRVVLRCERCCEETDLVEACPVAYEPNPQLTAVEFVVDVMVDVLD